MALPKVVQYRAMFFEWLTMHFIAQHPKNAGEAGWAARGGQSRLRGIRLVGQVVPARPGTAEVHGWGASFGIRHVAVLFCSGSIQWLTEDLGLSIGS
ncbi:MAG: hypothetical protein QOD01_2904 [Actinomycetota bacterium]|jgi:hypothetical protein|nr:hypothetical protein [Actinomycetota bacterium]